MIKSIELKNFQSHKNTKLLFDKGVNVIIGSSNDGKTAILRALNWSLNNRPSGLSLLSYWDRDKKGKPIKGQEVNVEFFEEDIIISRKRNDKFNGYEIQHIDNIEKIEAIGTDVPEQISELFNLSEVNLQRQFDAPFLLSESAAEIARSFNKIIKLDAIDRILSNAENQRKKNNQEIVFTEEEIKRTTEQLDRFKWIKDAKAKIETAKRREQRLREKEEKYSKIERLLNQFDDVAELLNVLPDKPLLEKVQNKIQEIEDIEARISIKRSNLSFFHSLVSKVKSKTEEIEKYKKINFEKVDILIKNIMVLKSKLDEKQGKKNNLNSILVNFGTHSSSIAIYNMQIENIKLQMPDLCPYCGNKINNEKSL